MHFKIMRIPGGSSFFTAEAKSVGITLDFIRTCIGIDYIVGHPEPEKKIRWHF